MTAKWAVVNNDGSIYGGRSNSIPPLQEALDKDERRVGVKESIHFGQRLECGYKRHYQEKFNTAIGEANYDYPVYKIVIWGTDRKDVEKLRQMFRKKFGADNNIRPTFSFPPLPDNIEATLERVKYLLSEVVKLVKWVFGKEE